MPLPYDVYEPLNQWCWVDRLHDRVSVLRITSFCCAARRESLLDEFERSGLSGAKFVQLTGLKYSTFACWRQRRRQERGAAPVSGKDPAAAVRWLEAGVEQASPGTSPEPVRVRLSSGAWVEVQHAGQAALVHTRDGRRQHGPARLHPLRGC